MAHFIPLTVTEIRKTTNDAVAVSFQANTSEVIDFVQGQYLTFRKSFDGVELRRSYSICVPPGAGLLQVGIKRVEGGTFSTWANTELRVGDVIEAMPPMGRFHAPLAPKKARHYLAFAGGSGITPVLSLIRTVLRDEPAARVTLVYANRAVSTIMFREEIEDLKNSHLQRLNVVHILEQDAQGIDLFTGRLDAAKCAALFDTWVDVSTADLAFICGPRPMMELLVDSLKAHGMPDDAIKYELFFADQPGRASQPAPMAPDKGQRITADVTLDGETRSMEFNPGQSLLEAALAAGLDAPFACKAGVCSTCKAKVSDGTVEMVANHALEDYEVRDGFVLTCQSFCTMGPVAYDYDQH